MLVLFAPLDGGVGPLEVDAVVVVLVLLDPAVAVPVAFSVVVDPCSPPVVFELSTVVVPVAETVAPVVVVLEPVEVVPAGVVVDSADVDDLYIVEADPPVVVVASVFCCSLPGMPEELLPAIDD